MTPQLENLTDFLGRQLQFLERGAVRPGGKIGHYSPTHRKQFKYKVSGEKQVT
jgi:hypothetical protein